MYILILPAPEPELEQPVDDAYPDLVDEAGLESVADQYSHNLSEDMFPNRLTILCFYNRDSLNDYLQGNELNATDGTASLEPRKYKLYAFSGSYECNVLHLDFDYYYQPMIVEIADEYQYTIVHTNTIFFAQTKQIAHDILQSMSLYGKLQMVNGPCYHYICGYPIEFTTPSFEATLKGAVIRRADFCSGGYYLNILYAQYLGGIKIKSAVKTVSCQS